MQWPRDFIAGAGARLFGRTLHGVAEVQDAEPSAPRAAVTGTLWLDTDDLRSALPKFSVASKSSTYTATDSDDVILCTGTWTLTLPVAATHTGKVLWVKNVSTGVITVDGDSAETIDGALTQILAARWDTLAVVCNGTAWFVV